MNLGMLTQRMLNWPSLNWAQDFPWFFKLKLNKLAKVVTPSSWIEYDWNPDNDPFSLVLNAVIWIVMCVGEVNSFFLINIFQQLPRDHAFNIIQQVFFCFVSVTHGERQLQCIMKKTLSFSRPSQQSTICKGY